jgi:methionine synthase I (cobalamin-dependent)
MPDFLARLAAGLLVGDGATGTELLRAGATLDRPLPLLNLDRPEMVAAVHRGYAEAGSDLVIANTFVASPRALADSGLADKMVAINRAGVKLARESVGPDVVVLGGLGPTGYTVAELDPAAADEIAGSYRAQADVLADAGADALILETFFDLDEARLALAAALTTGLPVIVSLTAGPQGEAIRTPLGVELSEAARVLTADGAHLLGANCTVDAAGMAAVAAALRAATDLPLMLQPNAGQPETIDGRAIYHQTPTEFATAAASLAGPGVAVLGGCCGTTPDFIRALRAALR